MHHAISHLLIGTFLGSAGPNHAALPYCGGDFDVGHKFKVSLFVHEHLTWATLAYHVPANQVHAKGVIAPKDPVLTFGYGYPLGRIANFSGLRLSHFFRTGPDRRIFMGRSLRLDCGGGKSLAGELSPSTYFPAYPFANPYRETEACFEAIQKSGTYRLSIYGIGDGPPSLILRGKIPLRAAMKKTERLWRRELEKATAGACRFRPPATPPT